MNGAQPRADAKLPQVARRYFDAVARGDLDALADCFAKDAYVVDVDRRIEGREIVREWARSEVMGGTYEIHEVIERGNGVDVLLTFAPAGMAPFRARYQMRFAAHKMASMNLQYA